MRREVLLSSVPIATGHGEFFIEFLYNAHMKGFKIKEIPHVQEKDEDIENAIPIGDRSGVVIEPMLKTQWFLNVKEMASKSTKAVKEEKIVFKPKFWIILI